MKTKIIKTTLLSIALLLGAFCNTQAQSNIARIIPDGISSSEGLSPVIKVLTRAVLGIPDAEFDDYTGFRFWWGYAYDHDVYVYSYYIDDISFKNLLANTILYDKV